MFKDRMFNEVMNNVSHYVPYDGRNINVCPFTSMEKKRNSGEDDGDCGFGVDLLIKLKKEKKNGKKQFEAIFMRSNCMRLTVPACPPT